MKIVAEVDDAPQFIAVVESICLGVLAQNAPADFVLIKIDNWFGSRWLGFAGKALGALGTWNRPSAKSITIPPFVPNRVVSQRRFSGTPTYDEVNSGSPIHKKIPSDAALTRKAALHAPGTALAWYSGNSGSSGRGVLMVYIPIDDGYWAWYAAWEKAESWELRKWRAINPEQIAMLMSDTKAESDVEG